MSIEYATRQDAACWHVQAEGEVDDASALVEYLCEIFEQCAEAKARRVLVDHRNLRFEPTDAATYEIAAGVSDALARSGLDRLAIVAPPERLEFARFYESLGAGAGVKIKSFERLRVASAWLVD